MKINHIMNASKVLKRKNYFILFIALIFIIFGFLGIGTVFFLVKYQWFIAGIAILIMLVSLYFTSLKLSLKLNGVCDSCKK